MKRFGYFGTSIPGLSAYLHAFNDGDDGDDGSDDGTGDDSEKDGGASGGAKGQDGKENKPDASKKDESSASDDRVRALEAKLERERKAREALEAKEKEREDEKKTELERAQERAKLEREKREDLDRELQKLRIERAIEAKAAASGARADRIAAIMRIVDTSDVTVGDDGKPVGVEAAIEEAKREFPEFFSGKPTANPGTGGGKNSDRSGGEDEPETDYDVGRALAKRGKVKKMRL